MPSFKFVTFVCPGEKRPARVFEEQAMYCL